ncbi:MAG: isoprenylcysteine carboxylmethyltransferase family protein [Candidatus Nanoarchaeia archaeon]|nr:isoprenylcysteine carboxylmethyltransferase family protein [Candidatus Nanoarchaeia archaeon]
MESKRLFGSGPKCLITGIILVLIAYFLDSFLSIPRIHIPNASANIIFIISIILTISLIVGGFISLPVNKRGKELVTNKAFKYIRHPIYAGLLDFFVFGLGFYLKSYTVIIAGIVLIFVCGKIVDSEERYLIERFGHKYRDYQRTTKKFIPWVY